MRKKSLGNLGENLALKYLQSKGYCFIDRNFRTRFGEIDLIFCHANTLIFVEVKTRIGESFGLPEDSINRLKLNAIIKTGQYFKPKHPCLPEGLRIDLVAIVLDGKDNKLLSLKHFENISF